MAKYPKIRPEEYHDPVYNFIIQGKKRKAKDVLPAYSGGKYDKDDDLIIFNSYNEELDKVIDASCFRCDIKHYNPDVEEMFDEPDINMIQVMQVGFVSFEVFMKRIREYKKR